MNALEAMAHEANLMSAGYPDHAHQYAYRAAFAAEKAKVEAMVSNLEDQLEAAIRALADAETIIESRTGKGSWVGSLVLDRLRGSNPARRREALDHQDDYPLPEDGEYPAEVPKP